MLRVERQKHTTNRPNAVKYTKSAIIIDTSNAHLCQHSHKTADIPRNTKTLAHPQKAPTAFAPYMLACWLLAQCKKTLQLYASLRLGGKNIPRSTKNTPGRLSQCPEHVRRRPPGLLAQGLLLIPVVVAITVPAASTGPPPVMGQHRLLEHGRTGTRRKSISISTVLNRIPCSVCACSGSVRCTLASSFRRDNSSTLCDMRRVHSAPAPALVTLEHGAPNCNQHSKMAIVRVEKT